MLHRLVEKLKRETCKKYEHLPKELAEKLVDDEVKRRLREEIAKIMFEIYSPKTT